MPRPDLVSHASVRSGYGVPFGVLLALSTRLCLFPDRGVTLSMPTNAEFGDANPSLWLPADAPELLLGVGSDLPCTRRAIGDATVAVVYGCCCIPVAIFGVRGCATPRLSALAAAGLRTGIWGCRTDVELAFAMGAILVGVASLLHADRLRLLRCRRGTARTLRSRGANGVRAGTAGSEDVARARLVGVAVFFARAAGDVELREMCDRASCVVILVEPAANGVTGALNELLP
jgi:hypothetical protein